MGNIPYGSYKRLPVRWCEDPNNHNMHKYRWSDSDHICNGYWTYESHPDTSITTRDIAEKFMKDCGMTPTPDSISQLVEVFVPCLKIMTERPYDINGETWKQTGWRGNLYMFLLKANRARFTSWIHGKFAEDSMRDAINFAAFYLRSFPTGNQWGFMEAPGNDGEMEPGNVP